MSPIVETRLSRQTLVESQDTVYRRVLSQEFDVLLLPGETVDVTTGDELTKRLYESFLPYTDDGDATHPRIAIIPFNVQTNVSEGAVSITAPKISGADVVNIGAFLRGEESVHEAELLDAHVGMLGDLYTRLFQKTTELMAAPGSLLWYEATPSQFLFVPPGSEATVGNEDHKVYGGDVGTFLLVDLDPRFMMVPSEGSAQDSFFDNLEVQFLMLTGEAAYLFDKLSAPEQHVAKVGNLVLSEQFKQHCPLSHEAVQQVIDLAA